MTLAAERDVKPPPLTLFCKGASFVRYLLVWIGEDVNLSVVSLFLFEHSDSEVV